MKKVSENIKEFRTERRLTQKELGALCGCSASQISSYECGRVDVPAGVIYSLAENAGADIMYLMTGKRPEEASKYDAEFRVYNEADRKLIVPILVSNGYDVGQHKRARNGNGKAVDYYIHITNNAENIESQR